MTYDTINDAQTIAGNGEGTFLAGRYRIVRQLGSGGMGSVWLAEDTQLDNKPFAVKMLPSILVSNKRAYRHLKDEALVAMKLVHPNIVQIRVFEENDGNPFLVMDYIDGQTLDDYLAEKGNLSEDETVRLLKPIAAALDYAHGEGVVHRDVKPANVMIRKDGHPYILDFGIAREIQETMTRVTGKLSSGTLLYMSPEQLRGQPPKAAQDVYSFATMAYECLKGEPPFSRGQIEYQILNEKPDVLLSTSFLASSIMKGLSKSPEARPTFCSLFFESQHDVKDNESDASSSGDMRTAFEKMLKRITEADSRKKEDQYLSRPIEMISGFQLGQRFVESELKDRTINLRGVDEEARGYRTFGLHSIDEDPNTHESYIYEDFSIAFIATTLVTNTIWSIILQGAGVGSEYAANNVIERMTKKLERAYKGSFVNVQTPSGDESYWYLKDVKRMLRLEANDGKTVEISMCFDPDTTYAEYQYEVCVRLTDRELEKLRQNESVQFKRTEIDLTAESETSQNEVKYQHGELATIILPGGASMKMIYCGSGEFNMGSPMSEWGRSDDECQHHVRLTKGFWLGQYPVTQKQWQSIMVTVPSVTNGDDLPVCRVSWNDCQRFIKSINQKASIGARLPTEAEWEYACRAGSDESFPGEGGINRMGWYEGNSRGQIHAVGQKAANDWGFYDMNGNVWEWCTDLYGDYSSELQVDPVGHGKDPRRVLRGGSCIDDAELCRSAYRYRSLPNVVNDNVGFRLCCSVIPSKMIRLETEQEREMV